jgi:uncharacterized protein
MPLKLGVSPLCLAANNCGGSNLRANRVIGPHRFLARGRSTSHSSIRVGQEEASERVRKWKTVSSCRGVGILVVCSLIMTGFVTRTEAEQVTPAMIQDGTDIPKTWNAPKANFDYAVREIMVRMRDGVKLHTVIVIPNGASGLPIVLERTPYDASGDIFLDKNKPQLINAAWTPFREFVADGYILVFQDVRGKYGSKGRYVMVRPPIGPLNPSATDDSTDAYDTVDWLVKNVRESNGRVGMLGSSYDGWAVAMALLGPHPALKVAVPESPMIDGWMGDDWFHYGAFRQRNFDWFIRQTSKEGKGELVPRLIADDYEALLTAGSAGAYASANGLEQLPFWRRLTSNPEYNSFWQGQAIDKLLAAHPSNVPTLWLQGMWDQEDIYGAVHAWESLKAVGKAANNHLVIGPWAHSQINREGDTLGPLHWKGDTAADFRRDVLVPFFDTYLKDRLPHQPLPAVLIYNAAEKHWDHYSDWPLVDERHLTPLYLQPEFGLDFQRPSATHDADDSYISDPAKPVPYLAPPIGYDTRWRTWLVQDQHFASTRTDVLAYTTPVLTQQIRIAGAPFADLFAKTSGTDADWVVKLIDVYPGFDPDDSEMNGYQLPVSMDIFRGRYRQSFADPSPIPAGETQEYKFRLPTVNYVFEPGHRIMVQIQSTLFPLYDRNPQTYVPNIFFAKQTDYQKATMTIERDGANASAVLLPVVENSTVAAVD